MPNTHRRRNSTVELELRDLRRRCVLQLVGDSLDESAQFADNEVELRRVGGVTHQSSVVTQFPIFCASRI